MTKAAAPDGAPGTRERIVAAASHLMQRRGYDGTGVKQISVEAGATLGSVYHFFPGGKKELAIAAIERGDREFAEELERILAAEEDPAAAVEECARVIADGLRDSDWADGCPVTSTALGVAVGVPEIGRAADAALARWRALVAERLIAVGVAEDDAHDLGYTVISTLEGAETAAQLARDSTPLRIAGRHLARLIRLHLP
ncbi:TetR/AcrR family transcriptional regulator [Nocardiopsis changdeensis]|uniref:TetR/AcrR family transcriptional regulator n=1 Tax=Nocardiopsis changdeensis TaxID=2831969 RepID=A0ABX8BK72_9ACTN|nr:MULTISPECIES: TetR/AcrR family transcriptional regulator [Nocardiopsis]QUX22637.1 TetR/AcrR family transcriptional regulator [Nocardiopsis changdeensis]QYX38580.1 TetR/AcrR family transcriptional regulator [Nocardiopsis sp. MT53]